MKKFSILAFLLLSSLCFATNHYVSSAATGTGTGVDWTNACPDFTGGCAPSAYTRGDLIYVADGTYAGNVNFNKATSGATLITIKKAIPSDHGTSTGWVDTMGDGTALFNNQINFGTSNWLMDGQVGGGPGNWTGNVTPFGFKIAMTAANPNLRTDAVDNVTIRHIELQGSNNTSGGGSIAQDSVGLYGATHFTISYYYAHDAGRCIFFISTQNFLAEYGYTARYNSTSAAHAELASIWGFTIGSNGVVFRYNIFTHVEGTGGLIFDNEENTSGLGMQVYGNVFYKPAGDTWTINNGVVGGWTGGNGEKFFHVSVYNNSFVNANDSGGFSPLTNFPTTFGSNTASNNIFYNSNAVDYSVWATHQTNTATSVNPFTNITALDFSLTSESAAGTTLASPYNADYLGTTRPGADGVWSQGALQFVSVAGNQYYVSPSGSDSNTGTVSSPWLTLNHADTALVLGTAGTVVNVAAGTYAATVTTNRSGASGRRITWLAAPGFATKLTNSNWLENGAFVDVVGFDMTTSSPNNDGLFTSKASNVRLLNNYLHDFSTGGCVSGGVVNDGGGVGSPAQIDLITGNVISGNIIRHAGNDGFGTNHCVTIQGIYSTGIGDIIENNIISGITGWGIKRNMIPGGGNPTPPPSNGNLPGIISNNTVFNNGGGIDITELVDYAFGAPFDYNAVANNIVVNNGTDPSGGQRFGIDWYHVGSITNGVPQSTHNLATNNLVYGNLPNDMAHHDVHCGTDASGSTAVTGIPISGSDGDGNAGGCPATSYVTDAAGVTATFTNFQTDQNTAPAASYNAANYKLKAGSNGILGGSSPTTCAVPPGLTPCTPSTDFAGTTRPSGAQDIGAWAFTSAGVPIVSFSPSPVNFGTVAVSGTASATAVLKNTGTANLTFTAATISGTNPTSFSITSTTCASPLVGGTSCNYVLAFTPAAAGALTANLTLNDNAAGSPHQLILNGTGGTVGITISPTSLNFGVIAVGSCSAPQASLVTSSGSTGLTLTGSSVAGNGFSFGGTGTCHEPVTLAPGASCTESAKFCPLVAGAVAGTLSITDNAAGSPHTIPLTGTGGTASATIAPTSGACGSQQIGGSFTCQAFTYTSTGNIGLTGITVSITGANPTSYSQTNNCGATLAPAANCTITAFFNPTVAGSLTATLSVASSATGSPTTATLSGTGITPPTITLTPSAVNFGNVQINTTSPVTVVTVRNTGGAPATGVSITTALPFAQVNSCGTSIAALGNCSISITASPTSTGLVNGTVSLAASAAGSPFVVNVSVTGVAPVVSFTPSSIAFGNQPVGSQTAAQNFTLANTGTAALTFTFSQGGTNPGDFTLLANGCGASLQPGQNCLVPVAFNPTTSGARAATVIVTSNASPTTNTVTVTGTGIATSPSVCLSTSSLDFGNQPVGTSSGVRPVTVTNCGTANLVITAVTPNPTANFSQTNNCGTVAPNATCTINGTFSPLSAGTLTGQFSISSNAFFSPTIISLTGFGTQTGATVSPSSIAFGNVTVGQSSTNQQVTVVNTGNTSLTVNAPSLSGANPTSFVSGACPPSLSTNSQCSYFVNFTPITPGSLSATLTQSFGGGGASKTVSLTGTGIAAVSGVGFTPTSMDFGNVSVGASSTKTAQIKNTGNATLNISSITSTGTNSGDYALTSHCGSTLAPAAICTVDATVTPGGTGARTANIHVIDDAPDTPQDLPMTVNGVAMPTPKVSLSTTALVFSPPSIQTGTTSGAQTITVMNTGNANLVVTHPVTLGGANPGDFTISDNCGNTVAAGGTCTATVNCVPTVAGSRTATISFLSNAASSPDFASASCTGFVGTPNITLAVSTINFGNQTVGTTSGPAVFTLMNNGQATATGVTITAVGNFSVTDTCSGQILAGSSCSASVTFTPLVLCGQTDQSGNCTSNVHTGQVSVVSNTSNSPQIVTLQGTAIPVPPPPGPITVGISGHVQITGHVLIQ